MPAVGGLYTHCEQSSSAATAGARATSASGTTAARNTARSPTTRASASSTASPSPATTPSQPSPMSPGPPSPRPASAQPTSLNVDLTNSNEAPRPTRSRTRPPLAAAPNQITETWDVDHRYPKSARTSHRPVGASRSCHGPQLRSTAWTEPPGWPSTCERGNASACTTANGRWLEEFVVISRPTAADRSTSIWGPGQQ